MKTRFSLSTLVALLSMLVYVPAALAVDPPVLDTIPTPIDAEKTYIRGTTEAGYKIVITGGSYQIPPIYADDDGRFELLVALAQESDNFFTIRAEDLSGNLSEQVNLTIVESAEAVAVYEAQTGEDRTAPPAAIIDETPATLDAQITTITGTAERGATVSVTGSDTKNTIADENDHFEVTVTLKQNQTNTYDFVVIDEANNISPKTRIIIDEESDNEPQVTQAPQVIQTPQVTESENGSVEIELYNLEDAEAAEVKVVLLSDIASHWAKDYIIALVRLSVVSGYNDNTFRPDHSVNRAEFTKMVLAAAGYPIPESVTEAPFNDVGITAWYAPYVQAAKQNHIINGYEDGTFHPTQTINRAEAMKILSLAFGIEVNGNTASNGFSDVDTGAWYAPYVMTAYELGVVGGYSNGNFGPQDAMTRGQVAKVIVELMAAL